MRGLRGAPRGRARVAGADIAADGDAPGGRLAPAAIVWVGVVLAGSVASAGCSSDGVGPVPSLPRFVAIAAGGDHTCALAEGGAAYCWGSDSRGQLGAGSVGSTPRTAPTAVATAERFRAVTAGAEHTCGLGADGSAFCWGDDSYGQLGTGLGGPGARSPVPQRVVGGLRFVHLSAGGFHTCASTLEGEAYCWGDNAFGQLGSGMGRSSAEPVPVAADVAVTHLDAGAEHTCGIDAAGGVWCWGYDRFGQLGPDSPGERCGRSPCGTVPVRVPVPEARLVDAGGLHSCVLGADGTAFCWGANTRGELGEVPAVAAEGRYAHPEPVRVAGGLAFRSVTLGEHHSCGLTAERIAHCWGNGGDGQVGSGTLGLAFPAPTVVAGSHDFASLSGGMLHTCGLTHDGRAICWGSNRSGQLGDGTTTGSAFPRPVGG